MKKILVLLLALSMILGSSGTTFALTAPSDVSGLPCEEAVKALTEAGIINGYSDGKYLPGASITRAEISKLIVAALGFKEKDLTQTGGFSDTKGHWAEKYIVKCQQLGIINGYEDGTFRPDEKITYDEVITMLIRALGYTALDGNWPANYIDKAKELGLLGKVTTGGFNANRGDVALLLYQTWTKPIGSMANGKWTANPGNDTMKERTKLQQSSSQNGSSGSHHHSGSSGSNNSGDTVVTGAALKDIVGVMKNYVKGEEAFDYLSYVYMGWRTTGGPWQNHVINDFLVNRLKNAGYAYSEQDKSNVSDKDFIWVQHDDSSELVWAPQYASLVVTSEGDEDLIKKFNVTSYSFDPTSDIYMDYYKDKYEIGNIDEMYNWITAKEKDGSRTNVVNGKEADLNKRAHLARNSCFTDAADTPVGAAKGVAGDVVYIGEVVNGTLNGNAVSCGSITGPEGNAGLEGKILLSDSSNATTFKLAKTVSAAAVMSTSSLDDYNNPVINGEEWYTDSARYAAGAKIEDSLSAMEKNTPIVQWNLSHDQKDAMMQLLSGSAVTVKSVAIGDIYPMNDEEKAEGQLTAIAEIKGTTKANERVIFMAHVQEPGACDNASGVGLQLELALKLKKMIDSGALPRPERTITFIWGDEMTCAELWLNAHPEEQESVVCAIDLDMVGEDPEKTGGTMRIEKTPDPSAFFNYTLDVLPGDPPYSSSKRFVRLPDSHTLWGAGKPPKIKALYLNDLYMAATQEVIRSVDSDFKVAVCPFEGGSDHEVFLRAGIPAVLTWHFTDYVYHTTVDTLDKASAREMEDVGITSLSAGYMAAIAKEYQADEMMDIIYNAAVKRFENEKLNTVNHYKWTLVKEKDIAAEYANELEVLDAWGAWYIGALQSCEDYFLKQGGSEIYKAQETAYINQINKLMNDAKALAQDTFIKNEKQAS